MYAFVMPNHKNKSIDHSFGLLIFLQLFMLVLCLGGPLSVLAPVPMALSLLVFGRMPALLFAGVFLAISQYLMTRLQFSSGMLWILIQGIAIFSGYCLFEMIRRNISPFKAIFIGGFALMLLMGSILLGTHYLGKTSLKSQMDVSVLQVMNTIKENNKDVIAGGGEEGRTIKSLIESKDQIVEDIVHYMPSIVVSFSFFVIWISFYSVLRLSKIWRYKNLYSFGLRDLLQFKTPEYFVYPLILALFLYLAASYGIGKKAEIFGGNLLFSLGVFYFFQGFGIFYDFLTFVKIGGMVKTIFMFFILMTAYKFVAIIGIFDLWFDFRKFFVKKNNDEGDIL